MRAAKNKPTHRKGLGTAKNRRAAATKLGLTLEILKMACDAGCPGFNANGSVDCDAVKGWLATNKIGQTAAGEVPDYYAERALLTKIKRQIEEVNLATILRQRRDVSEVAGELYELGEVIKATLRAELIERLPSLDAGKSAEAIRAIHEDAFRNVFTQWRAFAARWNVRET